VSYFALERGIYVGCLTCSKEVGLEILDKKLLVIGVDGAQTVMIDELGLSRQPGFPARFADGFVYLFTELPAEGRGSEARKFLPALAALDNCCHKTPLMEKRKLMSR
jgi:hypothetical protein